MTPELRRKWLRGSETVQAGQGADRATANLTEDSCVQSADLHVRVLACAAVAEHARRVTDVPLRRRRAPRRNKVSEKTKRRRDSKRRAKKSGAAGRAGRRRRRTTHRCSSGSTRQSAGGSCGFLRLLLRAPRRSSEKVGERGRSRTAKNRSVGPSGLPASGGKSHHVPEEAEQTPADQT